jgi:hypothetical protein
MKARRKPKPRNTPLKKIRQLADTDTGKAWRVAMLGRELSPLEWQLLEQRVVLKMCQSSDPGERRVGERFASYAAGPINKRTLAAIKYGNVSEIHEIAEALATVKKVEEFQAQRSRSQKWRTQALAWKSELDKHGERWPINKLASKVKSDEKDTGHATLRAICKEINFPLLQGK